MFYKYRCTIKHRCKDGKFEVVKEKLFSTEQEATYFGEHMCYTLCNFDGDNDAYAYVINRVVVDLWVKQEQSSAYKKSLLALRDQLVKTLKKLDQLIDDA